MEEGLESHLSLSLVTQLCGPIDRPSPIPSTSDTRPEVVAEALWAVCGSLNGGSCETSSPFHSTAAVLGLEPRGTLAHLPSTAAPVRDVKGAPPRRPYPIHQFGPCHIVFRV